MKPALNSRAQAKTAEEGKDSSRSDTLELEAVKWILILALSLGTYLLVAAGINAYYHPDIAKALKLAKEVAAVFVPSAFAPEPKEQLLFLSGVLVITVSLFLFCFASEAHSWSYIRTGKRLHMVFFTAMGTAASAVLVLAYRGLLAPNPSAATPQNALDNLAQRNIDFYFLDTWVYKHFPAFVLIVFPITLFLLIHPLWQSEQTKDFYGRFTRVLCFLFCGLLIVLTFFIDAFRFPYTYENKYDVNAVYYSVVQVFRGTPMLVDHFTNTYGLYPHFLTPILRLTGLSVLTFSSTMALLLCACFFFVLFALHRVVESRLLVSLGFCSVWFNSWLYGKVVGSFDAYYQMAPLRWFFPFLLIGFAVAYEKRNSRILYYASFVVFACGILWTPDFGLVSFLALFIYYAYRECAHDSPRLIVKNILIHAALAIASVVVVFGLYSRAIKVFYGTAPNLSEMFYTLRIFGLIGSGMIPMPLTAHPWMLVGLIYAIGLLYGIYHLVTRTISSRSTIVLLLSVLGTGLFSYYIGRSHNGNLFAVPIPFLLFTIFADDLLRLGRVNRTFYFPFAMACFVLSPSFVQVIWAGDRITALLSETEDKARNVKENKYIEDEAAFIQGAVPEGDQILVLTAPWHQSFLYDLSGTAAAINPGLIDLFFKSDYDRILTSLINGKPQRVFIDPETYRFIDAKVPAILCSFYKLERAQDNNGTMLYLSKREPLTPAIRLLEQGQNVILHELPDADLRRKFQFENGEGGGVALGNHFSIELIFKPLDLPSNRLTNGDTLLCNRVGDRGLTIARANSSMYIMTFGNADKGVPIPVVSDAWNYLALEVENNTVKTFSNGRPSGVFSMRIPYLDSEAPLYIGNRQSTGGFFLGDIRELRLSRHSLNSNDVAEVSRKLLEK